MADDPQVATLSDERLRPAPATGLLTAEAAGEFVLLHSVTGEYYRLNSVGQRVWELCDGKRTVAAIIDTITSEFEAPPELVRVDVCQLLDQLFSEKLLLPQ